MRILSLIPAAVVAVGALCGTVAHAQQGYSVTPVLMLGGKESGSSLYGPANSQMSFLLKVKHDGMAMPCRIDCHRKSAQIWQEWIGGDTTDSKGILKYSFQIPPKNQSTSLILKIKITMTGTPDYWMEIPVTAK